MKILWLSDTHSMIPTALFSAQADLIVHTGDFSVDDRPRLNELAKRDNFRFVLGNHDYYSGGVFCEYPLPISQIENIARQRYSNYADMTMVGNIAFINGWQSGDPELPDFNSYREQINDFGEISVYFGKSPAERDYFANNIAREGAEKFKDMLLEKHLEKTRVVNVFTHIPVISVEPERSGARYFCNTELHRVLVEMSVNLGIHFNVFAGHVHSYSFIQTDEVTQITHPSELPVILNLQG